MFKNWKLGFVILILGFVVAGCGERTENTSYYYGPAWTNGGKVIFTKTLQSTRKDFINSQLGTSYTDSVMTMTAAGTDEAFLFDVTGAPPYQMSNSPANDYIAYLGNLENGLFGKIIIRNIASGAHSGLEKVELIFPSGIKSFDWSDDGKKLVYCTSQEIHTIKIDGTGDSTVTAEANLEFVSWKYSSKIAFVYISGANKILSLINENGTGRNDLSVSASVDKPQISSADTDVIYGIAGGSYCSVDVSATTPATTEVYASFRGEIPRLSPDASKVAYSKTGEQSGVYVLDLSVTPKTETKVK